MTDFEEASQQLLKHVRNVLAEQIETRVAAYLVDAELGEANTDWARGMLFAAEIVRGKA